ncbi:HEAT repeat domain-containing protein [Candidatus Chlorohelix sp.]|uniref:HEAT repeat domain-containing protein n=1 Tax=Candidatus Chlorohelix sp. TaxID=3139201 RepID=UPI00304A56EC
MKDNSQKQTMYLNWAESMLYTPQARKINELGSLFPAKAGRDGANCPQASRISQLIDLLRHEDWGVRQNAAKQLGEVANKRAVAELIKTLHDDRDSFVRYRAAEALGKIANKRAVGALINALCDPDLFVRRTAAEALGKIKDPRSIKPLLSKITESEDYSVAEAAAEALGNIGDQRVLPELERVARENFEANHKAQGAIEKIKTRPLN